MTGLDTASIETLDETAFQKDSKAFEKLYDRFSGPLLSIIYRITQDRELSDDLLQDCFIRIWKNLHTYDANKALFFTWSAKIARNTVIDYFRSKNFKSKAIQMPEAYEYYKESDTRMTEDKHILHQAVQQLETQYRIIIDLVYIWGFTQDEVSKMLKIPLGTVKSRARTAILQLRKVLSVS